jgi:hypothetical protein
MIGMNLLRMSDGKRVDIDDNKDEHSRTVSLPSKASVDVTPGVCFLTTYICNTILQDVFILHTPGGGGCGKNEVTSTKRHVLKDFDAL